MKFFKKFGLVASTLAIAVMLTGSFASCDENGNPLGDSSVNSDSSGNVDSIADMTKEEWAGLSAKANFDNVTFELWAAYVAGDGASGSDIQGYLGEGQDLGVYQIDGNRGYAREYDGDEHNTYFLESDVVASIKSLYIETALAMLNNFEDFTYSQESKAFLSNKTISYNVAIAGITATLTVQNVKVEVLPDGYLGKISCDMKQQATKEEMANFEEDEAFELDVKVVFAFSEYGTTVLPDDAGTTDGCSWNE